MYNFLNAIIWMFFSECNSLEATRIYEWPAVFAYSALICFKTSSDFSIFTQLWYLSLNRLVAFNLTPPPVIFQKMYLLKRRWNPGFLLFLILSQVTSFLEISLKFLKSFRRYEKFICQFRYFYQFSSIFWIFRPFLITKKLMTSFFQFQHFLNRLFNNCINLYWY